MFYLHFGKIVVIEESRKEGTRVAYFGGYFEDQGVELPEDIEIPAEDFIVVDEGDYRYYINPDKICFMDEEDGIVIIALEGFYFDDEEEELKGALLIENPHATKRLKELSLPS